MNSTLRFSTAATTAITTLTLAFLLTIQGVGYGHINWEYGNAKPVRAAATHQSQKTNKARQLKQLQPSTPSQQSSAL